MSRQIIFTKVLLTPPPPPLAVSTVSPSERAKGVARHDHVTPFPNTR